MKKLLIPLLWLIYWLLTIIKIVLNMSTIKAGLFVFVLYLIVLLPLTFLMIKGRKGLTVLLLIILSISNFLTLFISLIGLISKFNLPLITDIISDLFGMIFFFFMIIEFISIIKEKNVDYTKTIIIFGILFNVLIFVNYFVFIGSNGFDFYELLSNICTIILNVIMLIYIINFDKEKFSLLDE